MNCILSAKMRVPSFAIHIRAVISAQALIGLGRIIAHILFFLKKGEERKREEERKDHSRILQCSA